MAIFGKYSKCFEAHGPVIALSINWQDNAGAFRKGFLIADANQKSCGLRIESERFTEIKTAGALVAIMRKYAPTGVIAGVFLEAETSDYWLPIFNKGPETPSYWLQLQHGTPPELRFIDSTGQILVRKSSQGSFTKRTSLGRTPPTWPLGDKFVDCTETLMSASKSESTGAAVAATSQPSDTLLPDYQRVARDRLARRLKTVARSLQKSRDKATNLGQDSARDHYAQLLQAYLFRVKPGDDSLKLEATESGTGAALIIPLDPALSPGQNLARLFDESKRTRRGIAMITEQLSKTERELALLTSDLANLRAAPMSLDGVNAILARHGLAAASGGGVSPAAAEATPYRTFDWATSSDSSHAKIRILVGKSAADSDALCRMAKSNDYWLHAVGTTGSHVIIPAREVKGSPPADLIKRAAILAIYYSKLRGDMAGEVYISRRQHIKKRSGMAPGLWQIVQAETAYYRYDERELQETLNLAR